MPGIGIIAPSVQMYRDFNRLSVELDMVDSIMLRMGSLQDGLRFARKMEEDGVDVIVSRGSTMELLLDSGIRAPLVNIAISMQDTSHMLHTAQTLTGLPRPKIALVGYSKIASDVASFSALLDMDLHVYISGFTKESIVMAVEQALAENADVIVGGFTVEKVLAGRSIPFIPHESGEASLRHALQEAKLIAYARSLEQTQAERFKAVMATSADGIFLLDAVGDIVAANPAACKLLHLTASPEGRRIMEVFPLRQAQESLVSGSPLQNEIVTVGNMLYVATITPFLSRQRVTGAVLSFQPATHIVAMEAKIRRSRSAKGMHAACRFTDIDGISEEIQAAKKQAARYAASDDSILLRGETGTGKELFAQAIHNASPKSEGPFVAVNCAALPSTLLESEFFGYEEGAFTGANRKGKTGFFELADQGTIFLDEVSGLDSHGQSRLLRVLQERSILRLGSDAYIPLDFRVITASNVDLWAMVLQGKFRQDLFFRLHVLPITLPPLRERLGDVEYLARLFLTRHFPKGGKPVFSRDAMDALCEYPWPGNVRELEYCIRRLCFTATGNVITGERVREAFAVAQPLSAPAASFTAASFAPENAPASEPAGDPLGDAERRAIIHALRAFQGNRRRAAAALGINASTLYRKMKRLSIKGPQR